MREKEKLSGRGKITQEKIRQLSNYYAAGLKDGAPDTVQMKRNVFASVMHMVSTDEDPRHRFCPDGEKSWCFFNRAKALHETPREHRPTLTREVMEKLLPVYERLSNPDLLQRCSRMKTQNANECFNAQVWRRVPKTEPASLNTVNLGLTMAVLEFNVGPAGFHKILEKLGMSVGYHQDIRSHRATVKRLKRGAASMSPLAVSKRKKRKTTSAKQKDIQQAKEGPLYRAGAF